MKSANAMTVTSLSDYICITSQLRDEWFPNEKTWTPWFRGQTCADWKLIPSLYRYWQRPRVRTRGTRQLEDELRQEFLVRAPSFTSARPQTSWGWYFLMQHSLVPTRLLDWTEGALIALYFALRDNKGDCDAAVWALDPWWLNKEVLDRSEVYCPEATVGMSAEDAVRYDPWLPELYAEGEIPQFPVAVYPAYTAQRISTQRSCFTVHGWDANAFDKLAANPNAELRKMTIAAQAVITIKQELLTCGVDEVSIYPDLDGLGRYLLQILKAEAASIWHSDAEQQKRNG